MSDIEYILSDELEDEAFNFPEDSSGGGGGSAPTAVEYTTAVNAPRVNGQTIQHPYADETNAGGVISGIRASSVSAPYIARGEIIIPEIPEIPSAAITIEQETETVPEPGLDGWVETLYLPMLSWNGGADIASFRQLMKVDGGTVRVSSQYLLFRAGEDTNWSVLFE